MFQLVLGFLLGFVASFLVWLWVAHGIVPRIVFSDGISKLRDDGESPGFKYRIKLQNIGRREAIDVETVVALVLHGMQTHSPRNSLTVHLDHTWARIPIMRRRTGNRFIRVDPEHNNEFKSPRFPAHIRQRAEAGTLTLEDVMGLGTKPASLQVTAFAYDSFSGSRKVFQSKKYRAIDIRSGAFQLQGLTIVDAALDESGSLGDTQESPVLADYAEDA